jgi:ankyrin repeat protein
MTTNLLFTDTLFVLKYYFILFKGQTPIHRAASSGNSKVVDLLLKSGAALSVVDNKVIKPSVKLRQSNIKLFK